MAALDSPAVEPSPAHLPTTPPPVDPSPGRAAATAPAPAPVPAALAPGAPGLRTEALLRPRQPVPTAGWRHLLYVLSGGRVNVGPSASEIAGRQLVDRVRTPLQGCHRIAVISLKGGVGKTTTTAALGATLASIRGDRVIAVDANPDAGTLGGRLPRQSDRTVRNLLNDLDAISTYSDVRRYTSQAPSRLEVLASDADPAVSLAFGEEDYRRVSELLGRFYSLVLTDSGTGLLHSAMRGVLELADSLIVVSSGSIDGARSADATLDWLVAHGHGGLVERSVTVICAVRPASGDVDVAHMQDHFARRCRAVVRIPFDPHLEAGAEIDLEQLRPATRRAWLDLAAEVAADFPSG